MYRERDGCSPLKEEDKKIKSEEGGIQSREKKVHYTSKADNKASP